LDVIVAGLLAPALSNAKMDLGYSSLSPIVHIPRFIDEMKKHWRVADVSFGSLCHFSLLNQPKCSRLHFEFHPRSGEYPESAIQVSGALSSKLISVEELRIFLAAQIVESDISWHKFYQHFPNVKVIKTERTDPSHLAVTLLPDLEKHVDDLCLFSHFGRNRS
jgi:hypothetical protein